MTGFYTLAETPGNFKGSWHPAEERSCSAKVGALYLDPMVGANPYIHQDDVEKPSKSYSLTFKSASGEILGQVQVDPERVPYEDHGLPGSILDIALAHKISLDHACGGVCACSTCHVIVKAGLSSCNEAIDEELDQLDNAPKTTFQSRLACQCVPNGSEDVEVLVPSWNRNLAREGS